MNSRVVCFCNEVSEREIVAVLKKGARSVHDVQKITGAATGCGRCLPVVDSIVSGFLIKMPPDLQQKIVFEE